MKTFMHTHGMKRRKVEVFHHDCISDLNGSVSDGGDEELEEQSPAGIEEIPWLQMKREMGAMNRTLDEIQAHLAIDSQERASKVDGGRGQEEEAEVEASKGLEPEDSRWMIMHGSRDSIVRDLQWNNLRIRRQLEALVRCSELGRARISALDRLFQRQKKDLFEGRQEHERVLSFHLTKQLEAGKCLQRYRYARDLYASWRELFKMGRHLKEAYKKILERTQTRLEYAEIKRQALEEMTVAHEMCLGSTRTLLAHVRELELGLAPLGFTRASVMSRKMGSLCASGTGHAHSESNRVEEYPGKAVWVKAKTWQRRSYRTVKFSRGEVLELPVVVPPVAKTWYGKMLHMLHNPPKIY
ncbi:uncharacterized protein LOC6524539 [Drosophila yakuba]|uniref:Uncharacterized protein n=1 Tax=Drosophila yakuba TaxID=7245 RepID=B4Q1Y3_DROYA|nr:uncharacterized protein LOC6524539 [Drosophila yakuba]EDX01504.1 uncharacterized protein Dyak_GE16193 [Drosophila yakuba]